jgi:hypothetical protein
MLESKRVAEKPFSKARKSFPDMFFQVFCATKSLPRVLEMSFDVAF